MIHWKTLRIAAFFGFSLGSTAAFSEELRVPGKVDGFGDMRVDNVVDGALVLKSFRPADLLTFNVDKFIAPSEPMKAGPQTVNVPGNFFFPSQRERWGFLRVEIKKDEFGYYTERGARDEVLALAFQVPFDEMVDMAMDGNLTPSALLPLIDMKSYSFKGNADHSRASRLNFSLSHRFASSHRYTWSRTAAPEGASDHVFAFQETPASRWTLTDIVGDAPRSGQVQAAPTLGENMKLIFARVIEESGDIRRMLGLVRDHGELRQQVNGLAAPVRNIRLDGNMIRWDAPAGEGWVSVIAEEKNALSTNNTGVFRFFDLRSFFPQRVLVNFQWVDPQQESAPIIEDGKRASDYHISLIFVGSDVPTPRPDTDPEDTLFHNMRTIAVEVLP